MTLMALGWSDQRQAEFAKCAVDGLIPGRVVSQHRSHFRVATDAGEVSAEMTGRLRFEAAQRSDLAGAGDFVALRMATEGGTACIEVVLPRATALIRKASGENRPQLLAANVDVVFIVTAPDGDFNLPRIERLLALVADSAAVPVIIISKSDLADNVAAVIGEIACVAPGVPVHAVSAHAHRIGDVEHHFEGNRTVALIGSSGVRKVDLD